MASFQDDAERTNIPLRVFLYTLDQIGAMIDVQPERLAKTYIYFDRRSVGFKSPHRMLARNIAPPDEPADWRVADREVVRWLKLKGFRVVERRYVQH